VANPLAGVVPQVVHPVNGGRAAVVEYSEKIEGEVAMDACVKAQTAPEVVKRITELENCLQHLANAIFASPMTPELREAAEKAKVVLKNRLEVGDTKHHFHSELGKIL
jgi:ubiquinone/menaquinone biosynthesis C-methylase UbiE